MWKRFLVVTFTEMATEDLKRKIRERLTAAISIFSEYYEKQDKTIFTGEHQFLAELLPYLEDIPTALRRLKLAEQNLDLASIYTIHGFCRRMLMQHAFNSGVHFNLNFSKISLIYSNNLRMNFGESIFMIYLSIWLHLSQKN